VLGFGTSRLPGSNDARPHGSDTAGNVGAIESPPAEPSQAVVTDASHQ
jgi:hypothetical protein